MGAQTAFQDFLVISVIVSDNIPTRLGAKPSAKWDLALRSSEKRGNKYPYTSILPEPIALRSLATSQSELAPLALD